MGEQKDYEVERRMNAAVTVEAGNGPGRWVELESQEALARLDARLNPDHGSAAPAITADSDPLEHRALIAFSEKQGSAVESDAAATRLAAVNAYFEGADSAAADLSGDAGQAAFGDIQPTPF